MRRRSFNSIVLGSFLLCPAVVLWFFALEPADHAQYAGLSTGEFDGNIWRVFNYFEGFSLAVILAPSLHSSINSFYYLNFLSLLFLFSGIYLGRASPRFVLMFVSIFGYYYLETITFSQYKMLLATSLLYLAFFLQSRIYLYLSTIAHISFFLVLLAYQHFRPIYAIFIPFFVFFILLFAAHYSSYLDNYVVGKIMTYYTNELSLTSLLMVVKCLFLILICHRKIGLRERKYFNIYLVLVAVGIGSIYAPIISGRVMSMAMAIEPLIFSRILPSYVIGPYCCSLVAIGTFRILI